MSTLLRGLISEAKVILLFHVTGTVMEIFKTSVGSWIYPEAALLRARDRFGDYGVVGLFACAARSEALVVETFLLSCRALGKGVEHRMVAALGDAAKALGCAEELDTCLAICERGTSADGQLTVWKSALSLAETPHDALRAVKTWIAHETLQ